MNNPDKNLDQRIHFQLTSCFRKRRFHTRGSAQDKADRLGLRAYPCEICFGFHLTSQVGKKKAPEAHYMHPAYAAKLVVKAIFGDWL